MNAFNGKSPFIRDIAPIGLESWVPFKLDENDPDEEPVTEHQRGLDIANRKYPNPAPGSVEELCLWALEHNHTIQCERNAVQQIDYVASDAAMIDRAKQGKNSPSETIALHYAQSSFIGTQYALHSHDDWSDMDYIDDEVEADIFRTDNGLGTQQLFEKPKVRLKMYNYEAQIVAIKEKKASHFNGETISKRRHILAVHLGHPALIGTQLFHEILETHKAHKDKISREISIKKRNAINNEFYEGDHPVIGSMILPYLKAPEKPEWLRPLQTSYYIFHPLRYEAFLAAKAAKEAEEEARAEQNQRA